MLYEITNTRGEIEGWLFGTIHALPNGVQWRNERINSVIDTADLVMVEVANLEDSQSIAATFQTLSYTPGQPDLGTRVRPDQRPVLFDMISQSDFSAHQFNSIETWGAAIMLANVGTQGDPANGVDRAIIEAFEERDVIELEGAEKQLRIFDNLPEQDQRDLLSGVVDDFQRLQEDPGRLRRAWLAGDEDVLINATETGIMSDPELREALLIGRNLDWTTRIASILRGQDLPLIAVGAGHLVGPHGLPAMLKARGYQVERIQ